MTDRDSTTARERDIDAALESASAYRVDVSMIQHARMWPDYAKWLLENARAAERWATKR